jgi:hypothetical protein
MKLNALSALQLFRSYTQITEPPEELAAVEAKIVAACHNQPFALQAIGSQLFKVYSLQAWEVSCRFQLGSKSYVSCMQNSTSITWLLGADRHH